MESEGDGDGDEDDGWTHLIFLFRQTSQTLLGTVVVRKLFDVDVDVGASVGVGVGVGVGGFSMDVSSLGVVDAVVDLEKEEEEEEVVVLLLVGYVLYPFVIVIAMSDELL